MSRFDDGPKSLVSVKLQGVALRTPPPAESYVVECFVHPSPDNCDATGSSLLYARRIIRLSNAATVVQALQQLELIAPEINHVRGVMATSSGGVRTQLFSVRPAAGDGSPFTSLQEADLCSTVPCESVYPFAFHSPSPSLRPALRHLRDVGRLRSGQQRSLNTTRRTFKAPLPSKRKRKRSCGSQQVGLTLSKQRQHLSSP